MEQEEDVQSQDPDVEAEDAVSAAATDLSKVTEQDRTEGVPSKLPSHDSIPAVHAYQIKPSLADKFKGERVKEIIRTILTETLGGQVYESNNVKKWTMKIANDVNAKVRDIRMKRYKHIVQVIMGELKGAGVKSGVRCIWDSETDGYASEIFLNDTIFCVTTVFAIYLY